MSRAWTSSQLTSLLTDLRDSSAEIAAKAGEQGKLEELEKLTLQLQSEMKRQLRMESHNKTELGNAIRSGHTYLIAKLLRAGVLVDWGARYHGLLPLHHAIAEHCHNIELAELLLEARADVNLAGDTPTSTWPYGGDTPLLHAARKGALDVAKVLCAYGATRTGTEVEAATNAGEDEIAAWLTATANWTPAEHRAQRTLMAAIWAGDAVGVAAGLEEGTAIDWAGMGPEPDHGQHPIPPLHHAAAHGNVAVAKLLLGAGAQVNETNAAPLHGWMPLHFAACYSYQERGQPAVAELLLEERADPNSSSNTADGTPLKIAVQTLGALDMVQLLCSYGATWQAATAAGWGGHIEDDDVTDWLTATADCITPLHHPTLVPPERARRLLRAGADLHAAREQGGRTPLSIARELKKSGDAPEGSTAWLVLRAAELRPEVVTGPWSRHNHTFWSVASRARAAELLWLWKWTVGEGKTEKTLPMAVWVDGVMPHAVE